MTITQLTNPSQPNNQFRFDLIDERKFRYGFDHRLNKVIKSFDVISNWDHNNYGAVLESSITKVMNVLSKDLK